MTSPLNLLTQLTEQLGALMGGKTPDAPADDDTMAGFGDVLAQSLQVPGEPKPTEAPAAEVPVAETPIVPTLVTDELSADSAAKIAVETEIPATSGKAEPTESDITVKPEKAVLAEGGVFQLLLKMGKNSLPQTVPQQVYQRAQQTEATPGAAGPVLPSGTDAPGTTSATAEIPPAAEAEFALPVENHATAQENAPGTQQVAVPEQTEHPLRASVTSEIAAEVSEGTSVAGEAPVIQAPANVSLPEVAPIQAADKSKKDEKAQGESPSPAPDVALTAQTLEVSADQAQTLPQPVNAVHSEAARFVESLAPKVANDLRAEVTAAEQSNELKPSAVSNMSSAALAADTQAPPQSTGQAMAASQTAVAEATVETNASFQSVLKEQTAPEKPADPDLALEGTPLADGAATSESADRKPALTDEKPVFTSKLPSLDTVKTTAPSLTHPVMEKITTQDMADADVQIETLENAAPAATESGEQVTPQTNTEIATPSEFSVSGSVGAIKSPGAPAAASQHPVFQSGQSGAESVGDQVVEGTLYTARAGHKSVIIKLNPDNLGEVRINLSTDATQQLTARLIASTKEAQDQLQNQLDTLKQSLESQGVKVERLSVVLAGSENNLRDSGQQQGNQQFNQPQQNAAHQQGNPPQHDQARQFQMGQQGGFQQGKSPYVTPLTQQGTTGHAGSFGSEAETRDTRQPHEHGSISILV